MAFVLVVACWWMIALAVDETITRPKPKQALADWSELIDAPATQLTNRTAEPVPDQVPSGVASHRRRP